MVEFITIMQRFIDSICKFLFKWSHEQTLLTKKKIEKYVFASYF